MSVDLVADHVRHCRLRNLSPTTIKERTNALRRLERHLAIPLNKVTADDLDQWQNEIAHLSPRYRSSWMSHVRAFYTWAVSVRRLRTNPATVLVAVKLPRSLPKPIPRDDLAMAMSCAPARIRPWLFLAAYAGLRAAEIAGLQVSDIQVHGDERMIVVNGKGNKQRVVPLSKVVYDELLSAGIPSRGYLFPRYDGNPGQNLPWRISHVTNEYLHGLGIKHTLHTLRHFFGSTAYQTTTDLRLVQELMGHASPNTTAGYAAYSRLGASAAVDAVAARGQGGRVPMPELAEQARQDERLQSMRGRRGALPSEP
ncbi:MAG: tyrosine-type recombinase/integrase [Frankiaceae bacterium]